MTQQGNTDIMPKGRNEIIEELERMGIMDNLVRNITKKTEEREDTLKDLKQMCYLTMLEKDEQEIVGMYQRGQLLYYLARILTNNYYSKTSRYYYNYKRLLNNSIDINDYDEWDGDY